MNLFHRSRGILGNTHLVPRAQRLANQEIGVPKGRVSETIRRLVLIVVSLYAMSAMAAPVLEDGPAAHGQLSQASSLLFLKNDWAGIEKQAHELRETKARFLDGEWKLPSFYAGLAPAYWARNEHDWQAVFTKLQAWGKAYPQSITQRVAHGHALIDFAWQARGGGFANTVSPEAFALFEKRLADARKVLEEAEALPEKCPEWSSAMLTVGLGQNWGRKEYDHVYHQAVKLEPTYYGYYIQKLTYLLPRWTGEPGEWQRFAEQAAREDDAGEGLSVLARIYLAAHDFGEVKFPLEQSEWKKVRQGFLDLMEHHPKSAWTSRNLIRFCREADDRELAKAILARLGPEPDLTAWGTRGQFETMQLWSEGKEGPGPRDVLDAGDRNPANCLAFSREGRLLAVGGYEGQTRVWDVQAKKVLWTAATSPLRVSSVAFSPDGKWLAIGQGEEQVSAEPGEVSIWDVATHRRRALTALKTGQVFAVQFSPDSGKLVLAGGVYDKLGEAQIWDMQTGETQRIAWKAPHTHCFKTVAYSPDGRALVFECNRSINVIDPSDNKTLLELPQTLGSWVRSVAFSPDGKLVAAVTARGWRERAQPGAVVLWDVEGWRQRKPMPVNSGLLSVAFMPDGRTAVTGGYDSVLRFWDVESGQENAQLRGHLTQINAVAIAPNGRTIASAALDGAVWLWDPPAEIARP